MNYSPQETIRIVRGYDAVIAGGEKYDRFVLMEIRDKLKIIVRHGTGVDNIDINASTEMGIAVTNAPGRNAMAVAEHALAMMLCLTRKICYYDRQVKNGIWSPGISRVLHGKTIGIIGFGAIGKGLAALLKGFSCKTLVYDKFFDTKQASSIDVEFAEVEKILELSDVISLHLPLTPETEGSIDMEFFGKMKKTAFFINTSRGRIVREDDLIYALQHGIIAGAGLDVFANTPIDGRHPFCAMDNVVLSPHMSAVTEESMKDMMDCCIADMTDFFAGKTPVNLLNPGYEKHRDYEGGIK